MATDYEIFVNTEIPRRPALLTFAITGYDGDPNVGAPAIITGAPLGTYYHRQGTDDFYQKNGAGVWVIVGSGAGIVTAGALTFTVDHNLIGAVATIPVGTVFTTQADITAFLAAAGTTAFKYLIQAYQTLPTFIGHTVTFNCAAGVHRPDPATGTGSAPQWLLAANKSLLGGSILIQGAASSLWTTDPGLSGLVITASVNSGVTPELTVAGTPFVAGALKARHAVLSTGQVVTIHDNTTNKLFVTANLSPAPSLGVSTISLARPSTIFRNSDNDIAPRGSAACFSFAIGGDADSTVLFGVQMNDVRIDTFSNTSGNHAISTPSGAGGFWRVQRILCDYLEQLAAFGRSPEGRSFQVNGPVTASFSFTLCCVKANGAVSGADECFASFGPSMSLLNCVAHGVPDAMAIMAGGEGSVLSFINSCSENNPDSGAGFTHIKVLNGQNFSARQQSGMVPRIRATNIAEIGLSMGLNSTDFANAAALFALRFENCTGKALVLKGAALDLSLATVGLVDGGGNTSPMIHIEGVGTRLHLNPASTLGAVLIGGSTETLANIVATGPVSDGNLNIVRKDS